MKPELKIYLVLEIVTFFNEFFQLLFNTILIINQIIFFKIIKSVFTKLGGKE